MKIVYVGDFVPGSTVMMRARALSELGHEVVPFNSAAHVGTSRIRNALCFRYPAGPWSWRLNRAFVAAVSAAAPQLVWVDKGILLQPSSIAAVKRATGATILHYNPDDCFGANSRYWNVFVSALPEYDVHLVMRDVNVAEYEKAGARRVIRWHWAFDPAVHRPVEVTADERRALGGALGFIGHYETPRAAAMMMMARNGLGVRIWGDGWEKSARHPMLQIEYKGVFDDNYVKSLCSFDVALAFLRTENRDQSVQRTAEIPATASFMLAERTEEHLSLFEEGKEAEYFSSDAELCDKSRYYLEHSEARKRIALAGRERCLKSGYSYIERIRAVLNAL